MRITIGEKIKELRLQKNCTQEKLAAVLGITGQAVSRWENGTSYPDLEMIPVLANFFRISIDQLFGYDADRQKRIGDILAAVEELKKAEKPDDEKIVALLRDACAEFPGDEKLTFELADALYKQGIRAGLILNIQDGYTCFSTNRGSDNTALEESIQLFRHLAAVAEDRSILQCAHQKLVYLYFHTGEFEKAEEMAQNFLPMGSCRELLLTSASTGENHLKYSQQALIELLHYLYNTIQNIFISRHLYIPQNSTEADTAVFREYMEMWNQKYYGLITLYTLLFEDGNFGDFHKTAMHIYLQTADNCNSLKKSDPAPNDEHWLNMIFDCLDKALYHAQKYDALPDTFTYTTPLADHVTVSIGPRASLVSKLSSCWIFDPLLGLIQILEDDPRYADWCRRVNEAAVNLI